LNIRVLIADDDPGMRLLLRKVLERTEGYELVGEAEDGQSALGLYESEKPEIVILDVEMPNMTGIECARAIQDQNPRTLIIFVTAHDQYMSDAFSVYAFDYLLKPFRMERVEETLRLAFMRLTAPMECPAPAPAELKPVPPVKAAPTRLMLRHRDGVSFIDLDQLLLVQREDRATVLYTQDNQRYVTSDTMSELAARLPESMFFRTHKSYIVNLGHIDSITPYGRWTYVVRLRGTTRDALITTERFEELQKLFA
jgi:two-component system LytT family response regulator